MSLYRPTYTDKKTGETKTAAIWWYEFTFAGKEWRVSAASLRAYVENDQKPTGPKGE